MPEVLILTGPPAAGKSTVARALADRYDRVAHIEVDTLRHFVTATGYVGPGRPGFERQQSLAVRNACTLARNFLDERFAVIIDDVVIGEGEVAQYLDGLKDIAVPVHLVRLLLRLEVCLARNAGRSEGRMAPERVETVWREFSANASTGATVDNSEMTPEEAADRLQALTTSGQSIIRAPGT